MDSLGGADAAVMVEGAVDVEGEADSRLEHDDATMRAATATGIRGFSGLMAVGMGNRLRCMWRSSSEERISLTH